MENKTQNEALNKYYWKKRTIVTYVLSVLVLWIHNSSFANYPKSESLVSSVNSGVSFIFQEFFHPLPVPLFFIISGYLFFYNYDTGMYITKLKKRTKTLLVPYILWNTLGLLFAVFTSYTFISNYFVGREKFLISFESILKAIFLHGCNGQFWFIHDLYILVVLSPLIYLFIRNKYTGFLLVSALIALNIFGVDLSLFNILSVSDSIIFYVTGAFIGKNYKKFFSEKVSSVTSIICIGLTALCVFINYLSVKGFIHMKSNVPLIILWCFAFWFSFDLFAEKITVHNFMKNSFMVFAMHANLGTIICKLIYIILPKNEWFAIINFISTTFLTLLFIELITRFLKKFLPKAYSLLSGSR